MTMYVVAETHQHAKDWIRHSGLALSEGRGHVRSAIDPRDLDGLNASASSVTVVDRPQLLPDMEMRLSMLAQTGMPIVNVNSEPLRNESKENLGWWLAQRLYVEAHRRPFDWEANAGADDGMEFKIAVWTTEPSEVPEFADAAEAQAWLDAETDRKAKEKMRRVKRGIGAQGFAR